MVKCKSQLIIGRGSNCREVREGKVPAVEDKEMQNKRMHRETPLAAQARGHLWRGYSESLSLGRSIRREVG